MIPGIQSCSNQQRRRAVWWLGERRPSSSGDTSGPGGSSASCAVLSTPVLWTTPRRRRTPGRSRAQSSSQGLEASSSSRRAGYGRAGSGSWLLREEIKIPQAGSHGWICFSSLTLLPRCCRPMAVALFVLPQILDYFFRSKQI